ncbi:hypothetical protein IE81DRAFT_291563 [Ceraceosorus guamensis]|uniref:Aminoglycoside phosphotransferase domain-containing protein n=1 Tax=Ceraceosorus guamensis TaxID=1522189 RepID=A0A316VXR8_9BASI|nr:hypothetical protein IE81DRAFT_291563 [Ceraceosorus guamensis]PWN41698.1 hypothetical protein IE81DRAFT_291563 [Ceraceosorus guamensis]
MKRDPDRASDLVEKLIGERPTHCARLKTLWAGYGTIYSVTLKRGPSLILKHIDPPDILGEDHDESDARKLLSYAVEEHFYSRLSNRLPAQCPVPKYIASCKDGERGLALLMQNVKQDYPILAEARGELTEEQTMQAIHWLARFHQHFEHHQDAEPCPTPAAASQWCGGGVWKRGGYSYLSTRLEELAAIPASSEWAVFRDTGLAEALDNFLSAPDQVGRTLLHGDVKAANLAFKHPKDAAQDPSGGVLAYDFQYTGFSLGVTDLAKFLQSSVPSGLLSPGNEERVLRKYHELRGGEAWLPWPLFWEQWEVAILDWARFMAGWGWWGNERWLKQRARELLRRPGWQADFLKKWAS